MGKTQHVFTTFITCFTVISALPPDFKYAHEPKVHEIYKSAVPNNFQSEFIETSTHPMDNPDWIAPLGPEHERYPSFWLQNGQDQLTNRLNLKEPNTNAAKNVIIFIGDGMSLATQMATRAYKGDENIYLSFEKFPYTGLSRTYALNYQVPDSANTANAILTGVKNNYGTVGVNGFVRLQNCTAAVQEENQLKTILRWAQEAGKSTGVVTTTRVTHATPSAAYASTPDRDYENDAATPEGCIDIARQLVESETGKNLNVILGGGSREFIPNTRLMHGSKGNRGDNKDLVDEWLQHKQKDGKNASYVQSRAELHEARKADYLFGHFASSHCQWHIERDPQTQPALIEMVDVALDILQRNENGFVLLVEGGMIDQAHHANLAKLSLAETSHFSEVVQHVDHRTNEKDTLLVVTADHSHVFTVGGYPVRKNNILDIGDFTREDSLPFLTLNYANGLGYFDHFEETGGRKNPDNMNTRDSFFKFPATVPLDYETHGGDDVGVYAKGPWAHLFVGNYEQSYIFHAMMYASCLGSSDYQKADACHGKGSANSIFILKFSIFIPILVFLKSIL